jgi:hypothetical protein
MTNGKARQWVCSTMLEVPADDATAVRTRGLADKKCLWKSGQTVTIGFLEGSAKLRARVLKTARRWTDGAEGGANLHFDKAPNADAADIRISFDPGLGSWSRVGTDAKRVPKGQATMNLGWAEESTPEKEFASVVLHEFGHAIALLHEHNHPNAQLNWNKDAVYADLMGPPNNWDKRTIDYNVFNSYPENRVVMSANPDYVSIMIYTIPEHWLIGQPGVMPSDQLSAGDIEFIRELYS